MNLKPYATLLAQDDKTNASDMATAKAREIQAEGELRIAKFDKDILATSNAVDELTRCYPLDFDALQKKLDELALLQRSRAQLNDILIQLFPQSK